MVKKNQKRIPASLQPWIEARRRFHLSHEHVQMARELGMNPKKLGKLDNHDQEPWKLPLPEFIRKLYSKRFGRERPDAVRSVEEMATAKLAKMPLKKAAGEDAQAFQRGGHVRSFEAVVTMLALGQDFDQAFCRQAIQVRAGG